MLNSQCSFNSLSDQKIFNKFSIYNIYGTYKRIVIKSQKEYWNLKFVRFYSFEGTRPIILAVFLFPINVWAEEMVSVKEKTDEEMCQERWDTLWSAVQEGHVEARLAIVMGMMVGSLKGVPSRSDDYFSRKRDMLILAIYSVGMTDPDYKFIDTLYYKNLKSVPGARAFFKCIETNRSQACAQILVNRQTIPSFQDYIDEVNTAIEAGAKPKCRFPDGYGYKIVPSPEEQKEGSER